MMLESEDCEFFPHIEHEKLSTHLRFVCVYLYPSMIKMKHAQDISMEPVKDPRLTSCIAEMPEILN